MSNTPVSRFPVRTSKGNFFAGYNLGNYAAAMHAALHIDPTPVTFEEIVEKTARVAESCSIADPIARAKGHLGYWKKLDVYLETTQGWSINPEAQFDPEWRRVSEEEAKQWWDQVKCK